MATVPSLPRIDRLAGHAGRSILHALTPRTSEPVGGPAPQSFGGYWRAQAASVDPRHPAGAFNLAAMLFPGAGRGGRLSQAQAQLLKQLNTHTGGGPLPRATQEWLQQAGVAPEFTSTMRQPYQPNTGYPPFSHDRSLGGPPAEPVRHPPSAVRNTPELKQLADLLGYVYALPQHEHRMFFAPTDHLADVGLGHAQEGPGNAFIGRYPGGVEDTFPTQPPHMVLQDIVKALQRFGGSENN